MTGFERPVLYDTIKKTGPAEYRHLGLHFYVLARSPKAKGLSL